MAIHSSIRAWRIPWTEEPGRLQSMGPQRIGHNWSNLARTHACREGAFIKPGLWAPISSTKASWPHWSEMLDQGWCRSPSLLESSCKRSPAGPFLLVPLLAWHEQWAASWAFAKGSISSAPVSVFTSYFLLDLCQEFSGQEKNSNQPLILSAFPHFSQHREVWSTWGR